MQIDIDPSSVQIMKNLIKNLYKYVECDDNNALEQILARVMLRLLLYPETLPHKGTKTCTACLAQGHYRNNRSHHPDYERSPPQTAS